VESREGHHLVVERRWRGVFMGWEMRPTLLLGVLRRETIAGEHPPSRDDLKRDRNK
jgi:hypothetical protein